MKLQQVYNTAREQQENSKRYNKRYSKFTRYSLLILFINTIIQEITLQKNAMIYPFFFFVNKKTKNINWHFVAGVPVVAPWGGDGSPSLRGFELKTLD
ncbi:MAG: hypothetical protein IPI69_02715 [Bacteroidales bacterium]|jgi:hypothetical protein|nr:hypothetical protein [Bacteroidales bacterium]